MELSRRLFLISLGAADFVKYACMISARESIFLKRVEGLGFHVEGEGIMSRVEGNIFFPIFFFGKGNNRCNQCHIKTNEKNLKNKWRVNIF